MTYSETHEEVFTYFDDWEDEAIEAWLKDHGLSFSFPTLCGSCCGCWNAEYWVDLTPALVAEFNAFAVEKGIAGVAHTGGIEIGSPQ